MNLQRIARFSSRMAARYLARRDLCSRERYNYLVADLVAAEVAKGLESVSAKLPSLPLSRIYRESAKLARLTALRLLS